MKDKTTLPFLQMVFYYLVLRNGFSLTGKKEDKTPNALAGECDKDLLTKVGQDIDIDWFMTLVNEKETKGRQKQFQEMISELNALRAGAKLDATKQQALDSAIKLLQGLKG